MTSLSQLYQATSVAPSFSDELNRFQNTKRELLGAVCLPTRKTEHWKYSAKRLGDLQAIPRIMPVAKTEQTAPLTASEALELVIENGSVPPLPAGPEGVSLKRFSALTSEEITQVTGGVISHASDLAFATLNHASFEDGLYLCVDAKTVLETPVKITVRQTQAGQSFSRLFVLIGENAQATVIENIEFDDVASEQAALINHVTDICLSSNARLTYIREDLDQQAHSKIIAATGVRLARDAYLESHCLGLGAQLDRHDLRVELAGSGSECLLNGICVTHGSQHYDNHTCIEHIAPHCQSNENYRCIAADTSQIVFNGRIHIHPDAQKTLGTMSNKNLLLSTGAEIDAKPELEIYADDVKCGHGTTIGQLNEQEVYYLKTRGIQDDEARQMLTLGFVLEVVRENPIPEIADSWEQLLSDRLSFAP